MVGVGVSEEDGVEFSEMGGERLGAEVGRGVDDDVARVELEEQRRAGAPIVWISGVADRARTRDGRDPHGSAGAEDGGAKLERRGQRRIVTEEKCVGLKRRQRRSLALGKLEQIGSGWPDRRVRGLAECYAPT